MSRTAYIQLILSVFIVSLAAMSPDSPAITGSLTEGTFRQPADTVGYATRPQQVEAAVALSDSLLECCALPFALPGGSSGAGTMIGAIVPHDDYVYAAPYYSMAVRQVKAKLVVMFGVAHRARRIGLEGKLIFDDFAGWKGPYGVTRVSPLRERLVESLPGDIVLVDGGFHAQEHSLEALIPFLQHYLRRDFEILPILVTRFPGDSWEKAVRAMTSALSGILDAGGLELGRDVAVLVSADCVHYGDEEWGSTGYAPFGTGREGYVKATAQDISIARETLEGPLSAEKIASFRGRVDSGELEWPYKVTWCGVYSIPFGLGVLGGLAAEAGREAPSGHLLGYGTSIDAGWFHEPGEFRLEDTGLGATNIATDRHWVGYLAMGYW